MAEKWPEPENISPGTAGIDVETDNMYRIAVMLLKRNLAEYLLDAPQVAEPRLGGTADPAAYRLD